MIIKNKIEKPFGPTGTATGYALLIFGVFYIYYSLIGIAIAVFGAFLAFTSVITFIDAEKRKIKFSNMLFGIIPTGKWIEISGDMKLGLEKSHRGFRTYSRGMRTLDIHINKVRIILYRPDNTRLGPVMVCESQHSARRELAEQAGLLGVMILES